MSYRETIDRNGRLHRRHYNGHRFSHEEIYELRKPDDSIIYEQAARKAFDQLRQLYSRVEWLAWWECTFEVDGKTANDFTWRQIRDLAEGELEHPGECGCVLPEQSCAVCKSIAHITSITGPGGQS